MIKLPTTRRTARYVGEYAEKVENRSLLLDKFSFHKKWGTEKFIKSNEAQRWSLTRITENGSKALSKEANAKFKCPFKKEALRSISQTSCDSQDVQNLRRDHSFKLLSLIDRSYQNKSKIIVARLEGRLAINLASGLYPSAGISLDRLFGLPYIPASAIKGVCRHVALSEIRDNPSEVNMRMFIKIFGVTSSEFSEKGDLHNLFHNFDFDKSDRKGAVSFLPAYPLDDVKLTVDLTNVHAPDYYKTGNSKSLQNEKPTINEFPVVETGSRFGFAMVLNGLIDDLDLIETASRWLEIALTKHGIGAKTSSGYGWFSIDNEYLSTIKQKAKSDADRLAKQIKEAEAKRIQEEKESARLASLDPVEREMEKLLTLRDEEFAEIAKNLSSETEIRQKALILLLLENPVKKSRWKSWKKKKPAIAEPLMILAQQLNIELS